MSYWILVTVRALQMQSRSRLGVVSCLVNKLSTSQPKLAPSALAKADLQVSATWLRDTSYIARPDKT